MTASIPDRVAAGVALLDREMPGWRSRIDVAVLDLAHQNRCVLGQLFGRYAFAPVHSRETVALGLKAASADEVEALTDEWRRVVKAGA